MIIVNGRIESTASNIEGLEKALKKMEDASRTENGCHDYTFSVELNDPNIIRITERWDSMAALEVHFKSDHMSAFQAAMAASPPKSAAVHFYEANEVPRPGN